MSCHGSHLLLVLLCSLFFSASVLAADEMMTDIVCDSNVQKCIAVGFSKDNKLLSYISNDGGDEWVSSNSFPSSAHSGYLTGIACDDTIVKCTAIGFDKKQEMLAFTTRDGGSHWTPSKRLPLGRNMPVSVDCDKQVKKCLAIGSHLKSWNGANKIVSSVFMSVDGGINWTAETILLDQNISELLSSELQGISCDENGQTCVAVGYKHTHSNGSYHANTLLFVSHDGGYNWASSTRPALNRNGIEREQLEGVKCDNSGQKCVAIGTYWVENTLGVFPFIIKTIDGGQSWDNTTIQTNLEDPFDLTALSCDSLAEKCAIIAHYGKPQSLFSVDSGATWTESLPVPVFHNDTTLNAIACNHSGQKCTAVGSDTYQSIDGGLTWQLLNTFPLGLYTRH